MSVLGVVADPSDELAGFDMIWRTHMPVIVRLSGDGRQRDPWVLEPEPLVRSTVTLAAEERVPASVRARD